MFVVKPILTPAEQSEVCTACGVPHVEGAMAYRVDLEGRLAGLCQFSLEAGHGRIHHLVPLPGIDDREMMIILGRAAMNFIDLCELHDCLADPGAGDGNLLVTVGFRRREDGSWYADMRGMFGGCGGHCDGLKKP